MAKGFHGVVVMHVVEDARGGETDAYAVGTPNLNYGLCNFDGETAAVDHGSPIRVGAMVRAAAEELVEEIAVRVMDFYAIEAGFLGEFGSVDIFGNDSREFGGFESARGDVVDHLFAGEDLAFGSDGGGSDRKNAVGLKAGMGDATDVPELEEDAATREMNGLDNFFPSGDLFGGVDAGGVRVAVAEGGDGRCFADDQSGRGTLAVILGVEIVGDVTSGSPAPGEGSHQNPVRKFEGA
jgi:hypothetical protein